MSAPDHKHTHYVPKSQTTHTLLTWSVGMRLMMVGIILGGMWLGVAWALQSA